jgi:hypothetical protein
MFSQYPVEKVQRLVRLLFYAVALVLGLTAEFLVFDVRELGLGWTIFILTYLALFTGSAFLTKTVKNPKAFFLLIPLFCLAISPALFASEFKYFLATFTVLGAVAYSALLLLPAKERKYPVNLTRIRVPIFGAIIQLYRDLFRFGKNIRKDRVVYIALGVAISFPLLLYFASLFSSSDPAFYAYYNNFTDALIRAVTTVISEETMERIFRILLVFVFSAIALSAFRHERYQEKPAVKKPFRLDPTLIITILSALAVLFGLFILVQVGHLFGNSGDIIDWDTTYSAYARQGFYFLIKAMVVAGFLVAIFYRSLRGNEIRHRVASIMLILFLAEVFFVGISAIWRINLYQDAYGLTTYRFLSAWFVYTVFIVIGITIVSIWRFRFFAQVFNIALIVCLFSLGLLSLVNIDRQVARVNVNRFLYEGKKLDVDYLCRMSFDTTPEIKRLVNSKMIPAGVEATGLESYLREKLVSDYDYCLGDALGYETYSYDLAQRLKAGGPFYPQDRFQSIQDALLTSFTTKLQKTGERVKQDYPGWRSWNFAITKL